jgi:hypothetical protein
MSTHEITAADCTWAEFAFGDTEEAQGQLKWLKEQLDDETDPARRKEIEAHMDEISEVLFQAMFDLI